MSLQISLIFNQPATRDAVLEDLAEFTEVEFITHIGTARTTLMDVLQKKRPGAVVLDLPTADEHSLLQIEGAIAKVPGIPVYLVNSDQSTEFLKRAMRAGVRDVLPSPFDKLAIERAVSYTLEGQTTVAKIKDSQGKVLAFTPVKGGMGATFLATNLASELAQLEQRVLVIDLNLHFGNAVSYITDRHPTTSLIDLAKQAQRLDMTLLDSSVEHVTPNLHVLAAPDLPYGLEEVTPEALEVVLSVARISYDFVILDTSRLTNPLLVRALDLAEHIFLIAQQTLPALQSAKRLTTVFEGLGYRPDKVHLVANQVEKTSMIKLEELEKFTGLSIHRTVPASSEAVATSINQGIPVAKLTPRDAVAVALEARAQELAPSFVKTPQRGWLSKLTRKS